MLDFEKRQPSNVEFFKVQKIGSHLKLTESRATHKSKSDSSPKGATGGGESGDKTISGLNLEETKHNRTGLSEERKDELDKIKGIASNICKFIIAF